MSDLFKRFSNFVYKVHSFFENERFSHASFQKNSEIYTEYKKLLKDISNSTDGEVLKNISELFEAEDFTDWLEIEIAKVLYDNIYTPVD